MRLLVQELRAVDQQAIDYRDVVLLIELVHQWPDDGYVDADIAELIQAQIVLHHRDDIPTDPMDVGVNW